MSDDRLPRLRVGDTERDEVLNLLQEAFIAGRLDVDEYEARQEKCMAARYREDLALVVSDLPEGQSWMAVSPQPPATSTAYPVVSSESTASSDFAFMSGKDLYFDANCRQFSSFAMWGGHNIHLAAALGPGTVVELQLSSVMGGYNVYVPEGVNVIDKTTCIMAGVNTDRKARGDGSQGTLVLRGFHLMGGVNVKAE